MGRNPSCSLTLPDPHISSKHLFVTASADEENDGNHLCREGCELQRYVCKWRAHAGQEPQLRVVEGDVVSLPCHDESSDMYTFDVVRVARTSSTAQSPASRSLRPNFEKSIRRKAVPDASSPSAPVASSATDINGSSDDATWKKLEEMQKALLVEAARLSACVHEKSSGVGGGGQRSVAWEMLDAMRAAAAFLKVILRTGAARLRHSVG